MANYNAQVFLLLIFFGSKLLCQTNEMPRVALSLIINNKSHTLPYFLTCLQRLDYPTSKINLAIYVDHNYDDSIKIMMEWSESHRDRYNSFKFYIDHSTPLKTEKDADNIKDADDNKDADDIKIREKALNNARASRTEYFFMLDGDGFLVEPDTLKVLIARQYKVVAPMLQSDGLYSNFGLKDPENDHTWQISNDKSSMYMHLIKRDRPYQGCHNVAFAHTAVLISLKHESSKYLTFNPLNTMNSTVPYGNGSLTFGRVVENLGMKMKMCNDLFYGYITVPVTKDMDPQKDIEVLRNLKVDALGRELPLPLEPSLEKYVAYPKASKYGCDMIYMINLDRRPERRDIMIMTFKELGMEVERFPAVDGRYLDKEDLHEMGVKLMPDYEDPYYKRPMKAGEIGCFLSHYYIWTKIVENEFSLTMILEDDVHFTPFFRDNFYQVLSETQDVDFDFLYLGRKILLESAETMVTNHTTRPLYSYWSLGYLLTHRGAKKLLSAKPLRNLLPVDEFLPIMFDQHPNSSWKSHFPKRDINALSALPLLVHPTHYTGMPGYISDTEESYVVDGNAFFLFQKGQ